MRSSDKKINDKLKAVIAFAIFIAAVIVISVLVFYPYKKVWSKDNHYDVLFLGASRVEGGVRPLLIDETMGCNSYSLASPFCTIEDRYTQLLSALEQGTLKTVVLEISFDTLTDRYLTEDVETRYIYKVEIMSKLEGLKRKLEFSGVEFNFWKDNYDNVYPALMSYGFNRWERNIRGQEEEKGYTPHAPIAMGFTEEEAAERYNISELVFIYMDEKIEYMNKIIECCLENDIRIVLINTPDTEALVWQNTGWEQLDNCLKEAGSRYGIEVYDFNLYKDRQAVIDDNLHYYDYYHLCEDGAEAFSPLLADILKRGENEDLSDLFYDSYEEAKAHSVYAG